ncbi:hypothetical protein GH733_011944, partial [Mirounga leonina]
MIGGEEIDLENLVKESGSIKLSSRSGTENGSSLLAQVFRYILGSGHYFRKDWWGKSGVFFRSSIHESTASWTSVLEWPFWTKLVVVAIGFTGGLVFMYVQCKVYVQLWRRLKAYNRVIFVQNCPDTAKKQEKNFSCNVNTDIKDAVVVPVSQTGTNSLPAADGGPPEVIP